MRRLDHTILDIASHKAHARAATAEVLHKINGFAGDTGINAKLSTDGAHLDLTSPDGYDIVIDKFDLPNQNRTT